MVRGPQTYRQMSLTFTFHLFVLHTFAADEMWLFQYCIDIVVCEFEAFWVERLHADVTRNVNPRLKKNNNKPTEVLYLSEEIC